MAIATLRGFSILASSLLLLPAVPASAQVMTAVGTGTEMPNAREIESLRPGQYRWFDGATSRVSTGIGDAVSVTISIPEQRAYVYRGGLLIGVATVSTGMAGHETPTGEFPILQKAEFHRSNIYSNAPMPFMQRLTWDGIALHAGHNPGRPASHGCIRLPREFARRLFRMTERGSLVTITDQAVVDPGGVWAPPILVDGHVGGEAFNVVVADNEVWPGPAPMGGSWAEGPAPDRGDSTSSGPAKRGSGIPGK
ncbi:L,D-transpeptidase family protein [Sphingosinithalassobacter portus]|uniref:L,D-transpeptidase family protein n=1 Tax=Stakelama portus TaxID=2676234 RepID=UPI000D6E83E4|nr:L,D-transpeptidase family protein [Sphingosinithalassobacter portus]